jgi:NAD(P)-dependent dehydrogenase (short-subunit alcohol dehydrogenase family)
VITGATSGLGLAVLQAMTSEGAAIVAMARNADRGEKAVNSINEGGGRATFLKGNVRQESDIVAAIELCQREFGTFDIMHNNAGAQGGIKLHETTNEQWIEAVTVNLTATFWGCKHAVLAMRREGKGGSIINTASILSFTADADAASYCATKTGILGLTRATALAYVGEGIRCNALCPGDFESPMLQDYFDTSPDADAARRAMEQVQPGGRIASPDEIAGAAVFLASDESRFVNGTSLVVDGAMLTKTY